MSDRYIYPSACDSRFRGKAEVGWDVKSVDLGENDPEHVDVTAAEAMQAASDNKAPAARDEAKRFLEKILAHGPVAKAEIEDAAEGNGIALRTLERAKRDLKIVARKTPHGGWTWQLPDQPKPAHWRD